MRACQCEFGKSAACFGARDAPGRWSRLAGTDLDLADPDLNARRLRRRPRRYGARLRERARGRHCAGVDRNGSGSRPQRQRFGILLSRRSERSVGTRFRPVGRACVRRSRRTQWRFASRNGPVQRRRFSSRRDGGGRGRGPMRGIRFRTAGSHELLGFLTARTLARGLRNRAERHRKRPLRARQIGRDGRLDLRRNCIGEINATLRLSLDSVNTGRVALRQRYSRERSRLQTRLQPWCGLRREARATACKVG